MYSSILRQTSYIFKHLSTLRHDGDFDETNLLYGPATPFIPGVSEPEPEIPLRDNEITVNSTPTYNRPNKESRQETSNQPGCTTERSTLRINSMTRRTVPRNTVSENMCNNASLYRAQVESQVQYPHTALQLPMPQLTRYPRPTSSNATPQNQERSNYLISSNISNPRSFSANSLPQNQVNFSHQVSNRIPMGRPGNTNFRNATPCSSIAIQDWRYRSQLHTTTRTPPSTSQAVYRHPLYPNMNSNSSNQSHGTHPQQSSSLQPHPRQQHLVRPVIRPPIQPQTSGHSHTLHYNPSVGQSSSRNHVSNAEANESFQAHTHRKVLNSTTLTHTLSHIRQRLSAEEKKEFLNANLELQALWSRNPNDIRRYLVSIMKDPQDKKWSSWFQYYYTIARDQTLGASEIEKDTVRMCSQVAETIHAINAENFESQHAGNASPQLVTTQNYNKTNTSCHVTPQLSCYPSGQQNMVNSNTNAQSKNSQQRYLAKGQNYFQQVQVQEVVTCSSTITKHPPSYHTALTHSRHDLRLSATTPSLRIPSQENANFRATSVPLVIPALVPRENSSSIVDLGSPPAGYSASVHFNRLEKNQNEIRSKETADQTINVPTAKDLTQGPITTIPPSSNQKLSHRKESRVFSSSNPISALSEPLSSTTLPHQDGQNQAAQGASTEVSLASASSSNNVTIVSQPSPVPGSIGIIAAPNTSSNIDGEFQIIRKKHHLAPPNFEKHIFSNKTVNITEIKDTTSNSKLTADDPFKRRDDKLSPINPVIANNRNSNTEQHLGTFSEETSSNITESTIVDKDLLVSNNVNIIQPCSKFRATTQQINREKAIQKKNTSQLQHPIRSQALNNHVEHANSNVNDTNVLSGTDIHNSISDDPIIVQDNQTGSTNNLKGLSTTPVGKVHWLDNQMERILRRYAPSNSGPIKKSGTKRKHAKEKQAPTTIVVASSTTSAYIEGPERHTKSGAIDTPLFSHPYTGNSCFSVHFHSSPFK